MRKRLEGMHTLLNHRTRVISKLILLFLIAGLGLLVWWRVSLPTNKDNLLINPGFDDDGLSGWQSQTMGEAQTAVVAAPNNPTNSVVTLAVADTGAGSVVGIGQRLNVVPLERYRLKINYRLVQPEQSSSKIIIRISQFGRNGESIKTDEFSDPDPLTKVLDEDTGEIVWQRPAYSIVTHWRTATVEIGLGLFGQQAATVAFDDLLLQRHPTRLSRIVHDPVALVATVLVVVLIGYLAGWPISRRVYKYFARRQQAGLIWPEVIWMTLLYTGLTLLLTYPVGWKMTTAVPGAENWDNLPHVWYQWWGKEAILDAGVWLDQLTLVFFPLNVKHPMLALHPYVPFVSLPFTVLKGALFSYNMAFLLSFVLSGLTGYLLCRYLTRNIGAAFVGGLIFAFYPNRVGHAVAGHILWMTNYFLPLYALSLLILIRRPSVKTAVWHGIVTALLALANPMDVIHGLVPILAIIGGSEIWWRFKTGARSSGQLRQIVGLLVSANVVALLIYLPFAWSAIFHNNQFLDAAAHTILSANLLAFILPSPYHPLLTETQQTIAASLLGIGELRDLGDTMAYLGLGALILVAIAVWRQWHTGRAWLGLTIVCAILSMGSHLTVGKQDQLMALPYLWLSDMPFFEWSRTPIRFDGTVMLGIAVMAAIGTAWLVESKAQRPAASKRHTSNVLGYSVVALLSTLILIEYLVVWPFPAEEPPVSNYYYALANKPIEGGILEIPPRRVERYALYYQTIHEHPLANGGEVSRYPAGTAEFRRFQHQFLWPWSPQTVFPPLGEAQIRAILADMNIRQIIVQRVDMTGGSGTKTSEYLPVLFGSPVFEDTQILVHTVPPEAKKELPAWQLIPDQKNWTVVDSGSVLRMEKNGNLYIYAAQPGSVKLEFQLVESFADVSINLKLNDVLLESINRDHPTYILPLKRGFNYIRLNTQPAQEIEIRKITIGDKNL